MLNEYISKITSINNTSLMNNAFLIYFIQLNILQIIFNEFKLIEK